MVELIHVESQARVDDQALLQHRLRDAELRYDQLFADAPVACHEIDIHGNVVRVNPM